MSINTKNNLNGWLVIDKPFNIGSPDVVSKLKWSLSPKKIGHTGTLDPLATGVLPIAFGHATKLIPFVMDGTKVYDFEVTWGLETDTDDAAGKPVQTSPNRPTQSEILSLLPDFIGDISQLPPAYCALKINGKRAYDLARTGQDVSLAPRTIHIDSLILLDIEPDKASFRVTCGKGTYVRSLGRDLGRKLGCFGYITKLRRVACGPFRIENAIPLSDFSEKRDDISLLPLNTALDSFPKLHLPTTLTKRLLQGQRIPYRDIADFCPDKPSENTLLCLMENDTLLGLVRFAQNLLHPYRIFNL